MKLQSSRLLVIAPHPDDEILGVGGTMARMVAENTEVYVLVVAGHLPPLYTEEAYLVTKRESAVAHKLIGVTETIFLDYPAVYLSDAPLAEVNGKIAKVVNEIGADTVLIPYMDRHNDHHIVYNASMVATRPVGKGNRIKLLAAYETISETHWNGPHIEPGFIPNCVVDITSTIDMKIDAMKAFASQVHPFPEPRSLEALRALALFRGSQAGFGYGEGLHILRFTI